MPRDDQLKLEAIELDGRGRVGQRFRRVPDNAPGGSKLWEADTWMAAVNYARDTDDIRQDIAGALHYGAEVLLVVHYEDDGGSEYDHPPDVWWLEFVRHGTDNYEGVWRNIVSAWTLGPHAS